MQYYDAERIIIHNWGDLTKNPDDKKMDSGLEN
jgi:hypothetical protein